MTKHCGIIPCGVSAGVTIADNGITFSTNPGAHLNATFEYEHKGACPIAAEPAAAPAD